MFKKLTILLCVFFCIPLLSAFNFAPARTPGNPSSSPEFLTSNPALKNIVILGTGGTIAGTGTAGETTHYTPGELDVQSLIDSVPGLDKLANLSGEQVINTASDDVTGQDWLTLAKRINELSASDDIDGFVITHGTDTLEETAYFLHLTLKTKKPVVVVGSMRPSTAISADGPMNLYEAVALARSDNAAGNGVMVVFSDGIYSARDVTKVSTFKTDAFNGRDMGCLGYMRDDVPFFYHKSLQPHTTRTPFDIADVEELPQVGIAYFHIDADPGVLEYMFDNYDGVVLAGAGNGGSSELWIDTATELVLSKGIPFVCSSRIDNGIVDDENDVTAIAAGTLNPQKARILLQLALTVTDDHTKIAEFFALY